MSAYWICVINITILAAYITEWDQQSASYNLESWGFDCKGDQLALCTKKHTDYRKKCYPHNL